MAHQADKKEYNNKDEPIVTDLLKQGLRFDDEQGVQLFKYQLKQWFSFLHGRHVKWIHDYPSHESYLHKNVKYHEELMSGFERIVNKHRLVKEAQRGQVSIDSLDDVDYRWYHVSGLDQPLSELSDDDQAHVVWFYFEGKGGIPIIELLPQVAILRATLNRKYPKHLYHDSSLLNRYDASITPTGFKWSNIHRELSKLLLWFLDYPSVHRPPLEDNHRVPEAQRPRRNPCRRNL